MVMQAARSLPGTRQIAVQRVLHGSIGADEPETVAVEEPLEVQIGFDGKDGRQIRTLSITMRTPGHDRELAAGLLHSEGAVRKKEQILTILQGRNLVRVELRPEVHVDWPTLERHVVTSSSCGVCGTASVEAVRRRTGAVLAGDIIVSSQVISGLPRTLRSAQAVFERTGGLHAAALFEATGALLQVFEDVGRHNALDKLIGAHLLENRLPLRNRILLLSGRASFELIQKAILAEIPIVAAVGAPSSLAVEMANESGMTLAGFVREDRFNIYSGASRISEAA